MSASIKNIPLIRTLGAALLRGEEPHGNLQMGQSLSNTITSKQAHMSHEQELQTIKEKSDFIKLVMCLRDNVEAVSDCCPDAG